MHALHIKDNIAGLDPPAATDMYLPAAHFSQTDGATVSIAETHICVSIHRSILPSGTLNDQKNVDVWNDRKIIMPNLQSPDQFIIL